MWRYILSDLFFHYRDAEAVHASISIDNAFSSSSYTNPLCEVIPFLLLRHLDACQQQPFFPGILSSYALGPDQRHDDCDSIIGLTAFDDLHITLNNRAAET